MSLVGYVSEGEKERFIEKGIISSILDKPFKEFYIPCFYEEEDVINFFIAKDVKMIYIKKISFHNKGLNNQIIIKR